MIPIASSLDVLPTAQLQLDTRRQVIRIVNASDFTIEFKFKPDSFTGSFAIYPRTGSILPKRFSYVIFEKLEGKANPSAERLTFIYRRVKSNMNKHIPKAISIDLVKSSEKSSIKSSSILLVGLRIVRSLLLLLLIIYNLILIISQRYKTVLL